MSARVWVVPARVVVSVEGSSGGGWGGLVVVVVVFSMGEGGVSGSSGIGAGAGVGWVPVRSGFVVLVWVSGGVGLGW